jgi:ribosomal protein S12 methylthiotransferase accessory factor
MQEFKNLNLENIYHAIKAVPGRLIPVSLDPNDPPVFIYSLLAPQNLHYIFSQRLGVNINYTILGSGIGLKENEALLSTLGEYIERYAAFVSQFEQRKNMILTTARDFKERDISYIPPKNFVLFHEKQYSENNFAYRRFTEDSYVKWIKGYSLIDEKDVYVPAAFVFIPYFLEKTETKICPSSSSGLSAHTHYTRAVINGIYEVLERDAIMINWYGKMKLKRIRGDLRDIYDLYAYLLPHSALLTFLSGMALTEIGIPTYITGIVSESPHDEVSLGVGMSTNLNPFLGLTKSIIESIHTRIWAKELVKMDKCLDPKLENFSDHVLLFSDRKMLPHFLKFFDEEYPVSLKAMYKKYGNPHDSVLLSALLTKIKKENFDVLTVDITPKYIKRELNMNVIRVIIPGLQLILAGENQYFGGKRLFDLPQRLGYRKKALSFENLKEIPHPYP